MILVSKPLPNVEEVPVGEGHTILQSLYHRAFPNMSSDGTDTTDIRERRANSDGNVMHRQISVPIPFVPVSVRLGAISTITFFYKPGACYAISTVVWSRYVISFRWT
jgi:hypothetical protein